MYYLVMWIEKYCYTVALHRYYAPLLYTGSNPAIRFIAYF